MGETFKSIEHDGWNKRAAVYDQYTARLTNYGIAPILDAAQVGRGDTVLDVCCGTGLASAAAAERGAQVIGVDIAEDMIATAKSRGFSVEFRTGDAEFLSFADASFDRVVCNFGMLHLAEPERAIAEAVRVLKSGGRYAYTTWCGPEISPMHRIIPGAIEAYGSLDVGLPPAPPAHRFADPAEVNSVMHAAGFSDIRIGNIAAFIECPVDDVIDFVEHAFVRVTMLLYAQEPAIRSQIFEEIKKQFCAYSDGVMVHMPLPAIVASGTKR